MAYKGISIFAKPSTYQRTRALPFPHIVRGSSMIRGEQMAAYLGCKLNPKDGYENDVCIHVKPNGLDGVGDGHWVDLLDDHILPVMMKDRPLVKGIAMSDCTYERYRLANDNELVLIPQHHCNFDREARTRKDISVAGFIGGELGCPYTEAEMRQVVESAGFKFLWVTRYRTREDVLEFYRNVDLQVVWGFPRLAHQTKCPLKVINAASFGIPTVAFPQACYKEVSGYYIVAHQLSEVPGLLNDLRDNELYQVWSITVRTMAEKYHISKIAEMYRRLG